MIHESRLHASNCFVTLTYDDGRLPTGGTLVKRDAQLFFKRLRKRLGKHKIRFFLVGEYGEKTARPHYHAIIFGLWPKDAKNFSSADGNYSLFTSGLLSAAWGLGHVAFGDFSAATARYCAAYTVKKITGHMAQHHYTRVDIDGEMHQVIPEFSIQSRRPGIGADFYLANKNDFRSGDFALLEGKKKKVPRYYDRLLERENLKNLELVKAQRKINARVHRANNTEARLGVREAIAKAKQKHFTQPKEISQ